MSANEKADLQISSLNYRLVPEADAQKIEESGNLRLPPQPVDATHALNLSAGVSNSKVFRGRSLTCFYQITCALSFQKSLRT